MAMDCNDNGGAKPRNWQQEDYFQNDTNFDISDSECIRTELTQHEGDIPYMFDETTPVKVCGDLAHSAAGSGNMSKEPEQCKQSCRQVKRRRMLLFDSHPMDPSLCPDETSSAFVQSDERDNSLEEVFADAPPWDWQQASCNDVDQSIDLWVASCLNDSEMNFSHDEVHSGTSSDFQVDVSEFWKDQVNSDVSIGQDQVSRATQNIVIRGRKSFIGSPPKLASSVAYPFAFVKPCDVHGDVTLEDINQRIQDPQPQMTNQSDEDPLASYPTSAFSGKPVVRKTKIRTGGGKGSITVIRTTGRGGG